MASIDIKSQNVEVIKMDMMVMLDKNFPIHASIAAKKVHKILESPKYIKMDKAEIAKISICEGDNDEVEQRPGYRKELGG